MLFLFCPTCKNAWASIEPQLCVPCCCEPIDCKPWAKGDIDAWRRARAHRSPARAREVYARAEEVIYGGMHAAWRTMTCWDEAPSGMRPRPAVEVTRSYLLLPVVSRGDDWKPVVAPVIPSVHGPLDSSLTIDA